MDICIASHVVRRVPCLGTGTVVCITTSLSYIQYQVVLPISFDLDRLRDCELLHNVDRCAAGGGLPRGLMFTGHSCRSKSVDLPLVTQLRRISSDSRTHPASIDLCAVRVCRWSVGYCRDRWWQGGGALPSYTDPTQ